MNLFPGLVIFFAGTMLIYYGTILLVSAPKTLPRVLRFALFLATGLLLNEFFLTHCAQVTADMKQFPQQTLLLLAIRLLKYSIGPLLYFSYATLTGYTRYTLKDILPHFIPQLLAWMAALCYTATSMLHTPYFELWRNILWIIADAGLAHLVIYITVLLFKRNGRADSTGHKRFLYGLASSVAAVLVLIVFYRLTGYALFEIGAAVTMSCAVLLWLFLVHARPGFFESIVRHEKKRAYSRSILHNVDKAVLAARLDELMQNEKVFCDEDLTLERLAGMMDISKHQLSELLNTHLGRTFNDYVNSFRVRETKRIILEEPSRSILSAAYSAGFNSKSVFYAVFRTHEGISPAQLRVSTDLKLPENTD